MDYYEWSPTFLHTAIRMQSLLVKHFFPFFVAAEFWPLMVAVGLSSKNFLSNAF
jgi:hypothetical protein